MARFRAILSSLGSRLGFKILAVVTGAVLIGALFSSFINLSWQRQDLIDNTRDSAHRESAVIQASLEHAMLSQDVPMLDQMTRLVASEAGFQRIWVLDIAGQVKVSSIHDEVGQSFSQIDSPCNGCHSAGAGDASQVAISSSKAVGNSLFTVNIISNQPACYACHGPVARPLGLLLVETPLTDLNNQLASNLWRMVLSALIIFVLLMGLLIPTLDKFVVQPVVQLARGAAEIGAGNLDYQCQVKSHDELGQLAKSFGAMRQQLKAELSTKERHNRELAMLNEVAVAASQLLDPQQILNLTIRLAVSSLGLEAGAIQLLNPDRKHFKLHACQGIPKCRGKACDARGFSRVVVGLDCSEGQVVPLSGAGMDGSCRLGQDCEGRTFVGVPLKAKGVLMGAMTLITRAGQVVTVEGTRTLKTMGEEIGLALANAIHFQNVRCQATLEERERLAREMHDSLAQALGCLTLKTSMTENLLSGGQIDMAQVNLRETEEIARRTYYEVREAIFDLRNTASPGLEFIPSLEKYLNDYRTYYGLNVQMIFDNGQRPLFPAEVSIQLTRIIQEALTNVRRHAQTNQAVIRFEQTDHHWCITVEDDGLGFDSAQVLRPGDSPFGLHIMRERAESVGAQVDIKSQLNNGTRVIIRMPLALET